MTVVRRVSETVTIERPTGDVTVSVGASPMTVAMPQVGSLWLTGHSFLDVGSIDEGGAGLPLLPGRIAEAFRVPSSRVTNSAVFGARARYSGWWQVLQSYNPGSGSWPFSSQVGMWVTAFGTNDARDGVGSADGWQECSFKASMEAIISRFRAGAVFEDSDSTCAYTGSWSTVTPLTDESATTTQCSGATYRKTTSAGAKVTITTPTSMGRNADGVWVTIGLQGAESGAQVQIKLDGVHHGYVNVGRGTDYGTSFGSSSNAVGYRIGCVYRLWVPTTYTDDAELYTTQHTIEVIHVANVGSGGIGLIFDYWSIDADDAPLGVCLNIPQPADSTTAGGAFSDTTVATTYNTWLSEVVAGFEVADSGVADPRVQVADLWTAFGGVGWSELSNRIFYGTDRLHPGEYGAKVAARVVQRQVARALRSADAASLLGYWPDALEPLTEAPTIFFADGTPLVVVDDFERAATEDALGGDAVEQVGAWGVDVFGQAYLVDALFSHWSERDDFGRDDDVDTLGSVEYDSTDPGNPGAWVQAAGTWGISSGSAYLTAKPGSGHAVATRDLGSTTQAVEVLMSSVDTDLVSVAKYGIVFRYVDANNYLLLSYGGVTAYLSKMVGGVMTNIASITSVGSRPHVEVGADDVVHFWSAANGTHSAVTYTITDAVLQNTGAGTKVGLWVASDAAAGLTGRFDAWRAWTTLADADAQSSTRSLVTWDLGTPDGVLAFEQGATEDDPYSFTGGPGLIYRYQDDLNYYRLDFSLSAIYGVATLYKVVAGTATSLGSWWTPLGAGIVHAISFDGSTHALYHDGVASSRTTSGTTITDSTFTTGNLHGLQAPYTATTSDARWRDVRFGQTVGDVAVRGDILFDTSPASAIDVYQLVDGSWVERGSLDAAGLGADPAGTAASLVDDLSGVSDAATARTNLGLGSLATLSAIGSAQITDGSIVAADLSASAAVALSQLATQATGTFVGNVSGSTAVPSAVSAANTLAALSGVAAAAFSFNAQDVTAGRLGVNASAWSTVEKLRVNTPTTADVTANVMAAASATSAIPLVVQGAPSQVTYLTAWQNSAGTNRALMNASGDLTLSSALTIDSKKALESVSPTSTLRFAEGFTYGQIQPILLPPSNSASNVVLTARGASGQTANLTEWQSSAGSVLASVTAAGVLSLGGSGAYVYKDSGNRLFSTSAPNSKMTAASSGQTPIVVAGASGQTANLTEWQNSSSTVLAAIDPSGRLLLNTTSTTGFLHVGIDTAARVGLAITAAASQTGNLTQWRDSSTNVIAAVSSAGNFSAPQFVGTGSASQVTGLVTNTSAAAAAGVGGHVSITGTNLTITRLYGAWDGAATTDGHMRFENRSGNAITERMRLLSSGTLEIGGTFGTTAGTVEKLRTNTPTTPDNSANVMVAASATTVTPLVVQLAASHTDSAIEVQDSTGAVKLAVDPNGTVTTTGSLKTGSQSHGNTGTTETIDLANGDVHAITLDNNCTLTFSGSTSGKACSFTLIVTQDGSGGHTITWPASVDWPSATAPTLTATAGARDIFTFLTIDGGTTWYGVTAGQAFG